MEKIRICFIGSNPNFLGGITIYIKNLIGYIKKQKKETEIYWIYLGRKNKRYIKEGVNYTEIKVPKIIFIEDILFNKKVSKLLKNNNFNIISSHAIWGYWMKKYKKKQNQKIIHTYHGSTYYFLKNSWKRFGAIKKFSFLLPLWFGYFIEKAPTRKANKIICVSEKVKKQIEKLYGKKEKISVIRTGVNLKKFKLRDKIKSKKELNLNINNFYGLYVGKGGFWTKGLDRTIKLSEEIHNLNNNFKLIVIGADRKKVRHLINKDFLIFLENIPREKMPIYYSASDIFFCLSRYEGGAPTLVTSEAMASSCLLVCSRDSEQEIIENEKNGLILEDFGKKDAEKILKILKNKELKEKLIKNSLKTIKEISIDKWSRKILNNYSIK